MAWSRSCRYARFNLEGVDRQIETQMHLSLSTATRATSTCSRRTRHRRCRQRQPLRLVHGGRQRLGTRTTCSQRWYGRVSASRQKIRLRPRSHQVDHLGRLIRPRARVDLCVWDIYYIVMLRVDVMCQQHPHSYTVHVHVEGN
jgi:hypothetical protein